MEKLIEKYKKKIDKTFTLSSSFQRECETENILKAFAKEVINKNGKI